MNNHATLSGDFGVIAVRPYVWIGGKISVVVFLPLRIVPKAYRRRGEGSHADQLAFFLEYRPPVGIPDFNRHAQTSALNLTFPNRHGWVA